MGEIGVQEWTVFLLVVLVVAGPLFVGKSPRHLVDVFAKAMRYFAQPDPRWQLPEKTVTDLTLLAVACVIAVLVFLWMSTRV